VIEREQENEVSEIKPSSDFDSARIVVTNEKIRFLIGQDHGDVMRSIEHSEVTDVKFTEGVLRTSVTIQTRTTSYHSSNCNPSDEVQPTTAYIQAQSEDSSVNWEDKFNYEKGASGSDRVQSVFKNVDMQKAIRLALNGSKVGGARMGPRGAAVGFTIGFGFSVWADISKGNTSGPEAPNPEDVARNIKKWQQAGIQAGNEKTEWILSSTGAAIAIAAHNSDYQSVQELENIDPVLLVDAIQAGTEVVDISGAPIPQHGDVDIVPEVSNLRYPVTELTPIIAELFEEGLFEELIALQKESDDY